MPAKPSPSLARISKGRAALKLDDGTNGRACKKRNEGEPEPRTDGRASRQSGRQGCVGGTKTRKESERSREGVRFDAYKRSRAVKSRPRYEPSRVISPSREISDISVASIISISPRDAPESRVIITRWCKMQRSSDLLPFWNIGRNGNSLLTIALRAKHALKWLDAKREYR